MIDTDITTSWFNVADDNENNNDYESITLTKVSSLSIRASFGSGKVSNILICIHIYIRLI